MTKLEKAINNLQEYNNVKRQPLLKELHSEEHNKMILKEYLQKYVDSIPRSRMTKSY